jgi:hypothetical protein
MAAEPTEEDVKRARKMCAWAASGLEIFRHKLACEFKSVRDQALAEAAHECELLRDSAESESEEWFGANRCVNRLRARAKEALRAE